MIAVQALEWAVGGVFALLVVLIAYEWLRFRDRPRRWLAASVVLLGSVACIDAASTALNSNNEIVTDILLVLFALSGWALIEFRNDVLPLERRFRIVAAVAVLGTIAFLLVAFVPAPSAAAVTSPKGTPLNTLQAAASLLLLAVWGACVLEPVASFWVHSGRLPAVQRGRLRALTVGYAGIIVILAISVGTGLAGGGSRLSLATTSLALIVAPFFAATFAPPKWLRRVWREREEEELRNSLSELLLVSPDLATMATSAAEWAARLVGADGAVIGTAEEPTLGVYGLGRGVAERMAVDLVWLQEPGATAAVDVTGSAVRVPLRSEVEGAFITVRAGPLTPLFGEGELARLREFGSVLASAMDRVVLFERVRRNAQLLDLAYDAILTWSLKHNAITYWNHAAEALYGWNADEAMGKVPEVLLQTLLESREAVMDQLLLTGRWEGEFVQMTKDGTVITVGARWALQRDTDGNPDTVIEINRDISGTKLAAEQLRHARDDAERASQAKSEYLSRMSHELRTPLTAMLGYGDLLEIRDPRPDQLEAIEAIQQASGHLLSLVNDVLDIARIESGHERLAPEPVSIDATVDECVTLVAPAAIERGIKLTTALGHGAGKFVEADRQRLVQSLLNLLSNAVKYSGEGASVTVIAETRGTKLRLSVADTGPGLTVEQQQRLFQPFERLGAERTTVQGTGLGLALTKKLVDAMGGTLGVDTAPGAGSTFWIELTRAAAEVARPAAGRDLDVASPVTTRHTVLYVEDNLATIALMEKIFSMRPQIRLITAMQGGLTLDLAREHSPDAVILDLHLPDIPGDEVLRRLRADPRTSQIPVVMFSADATERQIQRLMAAGARAYLTKPAKVMEFLRTLDSVLAEPRAVAG
ncbi:MAG: ATP-binding protein [Candidatus Dormibacteria bacterium]